MQAAVTLIADVRVQHNERLLINYPRGSSDLRRVLQLVPEDRHRLIVWQSSVKVDAHVPLCSGGCHEQRAASRPPALHLFLDMDDDVAAFKGVDQRRQGL